MSCSPLRRGTAVPAALALVLAGAAGPALAQDDEVIPDDEPHLEEPGDVVEEPLDPDEPFDELEPGDEGDEPAGEGDEEDAVDVQPPSATLSAPPRTRVRTLLLKGLSGRVSCSEPCSVLVELRRGGPRGPVVGHRSVRVPAAGTPQTFRVRVDAKARRLVRATTAGQLHLTAAAGDAAGNHRVVTRRVALRRRG